MQLENNVGIAGEFSVRVRRPDGSIRIETPMQSNLILDNMIKALTNTTPVLSTGEDNGPWYVNTGSNSNKINIGAIDLYCFIGDGSTSPQVTDTKLANPVAFNVTKTVLTPVTELPETGKHEGFVKQSIGTIYTFNNIDNKNITEIGLGNSNSNTLNSSTKYLMFTRALIKDNMGTPISITVLAGEVLEIEYWLHFYIDVRRKTGEFQLTIENNAPETYDYVLVNCLPISLYSSSTVGTGSLSTPIAHFNPISLGYHHITAWGSKEPLNVPVPNYSFDDAPWDALAYNVEDQNLRTGVSVEDSQTLSGYGNTTLVTQNGYHVAKFIASSFDGAQGVGTITTEGTYGTKFANFQHGIRMFRVHLKASSTTVCRTLVVVKHKTKGTGIPKTDKMSWTLTFKTIISRYNG